MTELHDQLETALREQKNTAKNGGEVRHAPAAAEAIRPLMETAAELAHIGKNPAPEPVMRYKYLSLQRQPRLWFTWVHMSRLATVSTAAFLLFSAVSGTAYAAAQSLPGQLLFPLRKTAERVELSLTRDPVKKADLQIALTKKRMNDVQKVFQGQNRDSALEIAALNELSRQTDETIQSVKNAASSNSLPTVNHPLVASLENITKEQQTILNKIKPDGGAQQVAMNVQASANSNIGQVDQIKKIIEVSSAAQEQALASLNSDPNAVTASGTLASFNQGSLTVEKTAFTLSPATVIKDANGRAVAALQQRDLNTRVEVKGTRQDNGSLLAAEIVLLDSPAVSAGGSVEGASTGTPATVAAGTASSTKPSEGKKIDGAIVGGATGTAASLENNASTTPPEDNTKAIGTFILEDPSPQFVP